MFAVFVFIHRPDCTSPHNPINCHPGCYSRPLVARRPGSHLGLVMWLD